IIFLLCIPGSDLPDAPPLLNIPYFDKWVHFILFALFVILWCRVLSLKKSRAKMTQKFVWIFLLGVFLGYAMELVQKYWIPNRDYDVWDIAADGIGALAGLLISLKMFIKK